jgi:hypothetical protein
MELRGLPTDPTELWKYLQSTNISDLPPELQQVVEAKKSEFTEGDRDKIDTEGEFRRLMQQIVGQDGESLPNNPGVEAINGMTQADLAQLLIDWVQQQQNNRPAGGGQPSQGRNLGQLSGPGGGGGAHPVHASGGGGTTGGGGGGGTTAAGGGGSVTPTGAPTDTSSIRGNTNAEKAFNYFVSKGLTPEQAAGIVGNLQAESGVKPGQHQIGGPAFGIAQWEGGRQDNLRAFAAQQGKPVDDLGVQLDFLWQELQGPENAAFQSLKGAGSAQEAAAIFENEFERPAANHNAERGALAAAVLQEFGGGGGGGHAGHAHA